MFRWKVISFWEDFNMKTSQHGDNYWGNFTESAMFYVKPIFILPVEAIYKVKYSE